MLLPEEQLAFVMFEKGNSKMQVMYAIDKPFEEVNKLYSKFLSKNKFKKRKNLSEPKNFQEEIYYLTALSENPISIRKTDNYYRISVQLGMKTLYYKAETFQGCVRWINNVANKEEEVEFY